MYFTIRTGWPLEPSVLLSLCNFSCYYCSLIAINVNYKIQWLHSLNSLCSQSSKGSSGVPWAIKKKNCASHNCTTAMGCAYFNSLHETKLLGPATHSIWPLSHLLFLPFFPQIIVLSGPRITLIAELEEMNYVEFMPLIFFLNVL